MNRKNISGLVLTTVLIGTLILAFSPQMIAIGSHAPHDPILIQSDDHFTSANGVVSGSGTAIDPYIISGWNITGGDFGIKIATTHKYFIIQDNWIANSSYHGISINFVANGTCEISRNVVRFIKGDGILILGSNQALVCDNDVQFSKDSGIVLRDSNFCNLSRNIADLNNQKVAGGSAGIYIDTSSFNKVIENYARHNSPVFAPGIWIIRSSKNNLVSKNVIDSNSLGILFDNECDENIVESNTITQNTGDGIQMWKSSDNTIKENSITGNQVGIRVLNSSGNSLFHNNILDNPDTTYIEYSTNTWDDGYPSGGNYWSDYNGIDEKNGPNQDIVGSDGIGDTPYIINAHNQDNYPLMMPWSIFDPWGDGWSEQEPDGILNFVETIAESPYSFTSYDYFKNGFALGSYEIEVGGGYVGVDVDGKITAWAEAHVNDQEKPDWSTDVGEIFGIAYIDLSEELISLLLNLINLKCPGLGTIFDVISTFAPTCSDDNVRMAVIFNVGNPEVDYDTIISFAYESNVELAELYLSSFVDIWFLDDDCKMSYGFKFTRVPELTLENIVEAGLKTVFALMLLNWGKTLANMVEVPMEDLSLVWRIIWDNLKTIIGFKEGLEYVEIHGKRFYKYIAAWLDDFDGDIDMELAVDETIALGNDILVSEYGFHSGEYAYGEFMIIDLEALTEQNVVLIIDGLEAELPEESYFVTLRIMNYDGSLVEYEICESITSGQIHEYPIVEAETGEMTIVRWEHIFEDVQRGTTLKISIDDRYFQFKAADKEFPMTQSCVMKTYRQTIFIWHKDDEIELVATAINTRIDYCFAYAKDMQTRSRYLLIDKPGIE